jgi:thiamine pyrophosphate-dependent acetolactate synthase large subunit-like protein
LFNVAKAGDIDSAVEAAFKSGKPHLVEIEGKR